MSTILYPFGDLTVIVPTVTEVEDSPANTFHIEETIEDNATFINAADLDQETELALNAGNFLKAGAIVIVKASNDSGDTNDLTVDSDTILGNTISGVDGKTKYAFYFYNGTKFVELNQNQVD